MLWFSIYNSTHRRPNPTCLISYWGSVHYKALSISLRHILEGGTDKGCKTGHYLAFYKQLNPCSI